MRISSIEQHAIKHVLEIGARHGYGNMIGHLQTAWMRMLIKSGLSEDAAREAATGFHAYPIAMQTDLVERGFWDESGASYNA